MPLPRKLRNKYLSDIRTQYAANLTPATVERLQKRDYRRKLAQATRDAKRGLIELHIFPIREQPVRSCRFEGSYRV